MDITQLDKIKGFSNWMDRKPRAWLLFVLSAGVGFFGYGYAHRGIALERCQDDRAAILEQSSRDKDETTKLFYDLLQDSRGVHEAQKAQADSTITVLDKTKKVVKEVKTKL